MTTSNRRSILARRSSTCASKKAAVNEGAVIAFGDAVEFGAWLDEHLDIQAGVWLKIAKKGSGVPPLTDDEAVELGLCYGWISGQRAAAGHK